MSETLWRWLMRPFRVAAGVWRRDPEYLGRLGLHRFAKTSPAGPTGWSPRGHARRSGATGNVKTPVSAMELFERTFPDLAPLGLYPDPSPAPAARLTLLTDSLAPADLRHGDVAAVLFAASLAKLKGLDLRIVTRSAPPKPSLIGALLTAQGVSYPGNIAFDYAPARRDARRLAVSADELLLTTSWRTTWSALKSFSPSRMIYLVQDDECLRYPAGDEQLRCREILCDARLGFIVQTAMLRDHLVAEGMTGIAERAVAFEPAFPLSLYYPEPRHPSAKRQFILYAEPGEPGDLFFRSLEAVAGAIQAGLFPAQDWDVLIVGNAIPNIELPRGVRPKVIKRPPGVVDGALIRCADVGLSCRSTPYPDYLTLALTASGAVAVTNRYRSQQSIDGYCANILSADPVTGDLVATLGAAMQLAENAPLRQANASAACFHRDWTSAFAPVLNAVRGS